MSFKKIEKKDCYVYIPEVGPGEVSVLVFYPGIDVSEQMGKSYMPPLIVKAVPDWFDKFVIVIPFQHSRKWSSVKSQYEEEIKKVNLTVANLTISIFSGSGNGSADIQKSLPGIYTDITSYGSGLRNFIMMDPSASADLTSNVDKIKTYNTKLRKEGNALAIINYLMYNEANWASYASLQKGFKALAAETQYTTGLMDTHGLEESDYFNNVQHVKKSHMDIPTEMLVFYKPKIESTLESPILGPSNPAPSPKPVIVYKVYVDMGGVLFEKGPGDETSADDSLTYWGPGKTLWESIKKYNPIILSAVGTTNKQTIIDNRKALIKANLVPEPQSLFVDSGVQKDQYAESSAILVDDNKSNIDAWVKKGGIGVFHDTTDPNNMNGNTIKSLEKIIGSQSGGLTYSTLAGVTGGSGASGASGGSASPPPTIQMYVVFPENFVAKAREDVPKFTIWVGPIQPEEPVEGFTELFSDDDTGSLSDNQYTNEYIEAEFAGEDEIISYNETTDEPMGDYYYDADGNLVSNLPSTSTSTSTTTTGTEGTGGTGEVSNVSVGSSVIGPGPPAGSKLITGSGKTWYIGSAGVGIAGHRLKPILGDLQKHLRANGYPSAEIGNNGITRDLVASVYPNSPLRAVASLHGAGLAIDVTFKIPGKKWSGIGENGNLASDPQLTKVIWNFVKAQGDITWGAQFAKSDPANGVVKGRGIDEYHHFEIKADKIADYWKPYEKDLKAMGFDYKTLNKYGRDSPIYKVMKQLLNSKGIS